MASGMEQVGGGADGQWNEAGKHWNEVGKYGVGGVGTEKQPLKHCLWI